MFQIKQIEPGVFKVPYVIPKSMEQRRPEFESALLSAQSNLRKQAQRYAWENLTDEPFLFLAEIYDNKAWFDSRLLYLSDGPKDFEVPRTFSAVLEKIY